MRHLALLAGAVVLALSGCKKEGPAGQPAPNPAAPAPSAVAPPSAGPEGRLALDADKLARFMKYQQRMLEVYAETMKDIQALDARADAGEYGGVAGALAAANDSVRYIEKRQQAEEKARREAGLSEQEADDIGQLVSDVVMKRQLGKTMSVDETIRQMEQMRAALPKDQQAGVDQALEELKKSSADLSNLAEERRKYGDAAVNLVLSKEAELARYHEQLMNVWSGKGKP